MLYYFQVSRLKSLLRRNHLAWTSSRKHKDVNMSEKDDDVFWGVAPCGLVEVSHVSERGLLAASVIRAIGLWWWRQQVPLKLRLICIGLRGATPPKTVILRLVHAVKSRSVRENLYRQEGGETFCVYCSKKLAFTQENWMYVTGAQGDCTGTQNQLGHFTCDAGRNWSALSYETLLTWRDINTYLSQ